MNTQNVVKIGLVVLLVLTALTVTASAANYYVYANFDTSNTGGVYVPGQGVGSYQDKLYVASGGSCYVYQVTIPTGSDPNMHPDNPDDTGPIAPRTLTLVKTHNIAGDIGSTYQSQNEFYVDASGIYYGANNGIHKWDHSWNYQGLVVTVGTYAESLAYDSATGTWYAGRWNRQIYSFQVGVDTAWQYEFTYPTYAGSHHDGMEYVYGCLWISDMTSNKIGKWQKGATGWTELDVFDYTNPVDDDVEGMGHGSFDHFWCTGWSRLYELGGGKGVLQPDIVAVEYKLVDYTLNGNIFEESLRVKFENRGNGDAYDVGATMASAPPNTDFTDDAGDPNDNNCDPTVTAGDIPVGGSAWSTDTFTIRIDLAYTPAPDPCDEAYWDVEYDDEDVYHHIIGGVPEFPPGEGPNCCP